jgi:hypothetical protein
VVIENFTQIEPHFAKGLVIEKIWLKHNELSPKYQSLGSLTSAPEGLIHYRPFKNDCFTYVDRILTETDQPTTKLVRHEDKVIHNVCRGIFLYLEAFHGI